jgi:hypothetical protein
MASAYSESQFLMTFVGMVYWLNTEQSYSFLLAGFHGFALSATRLTGIPLAIYPLFVIFSQSSNSNFSGLKSWLKTNSKYAIAAFLSALGGLLFFVFCQWKFGVWDLYMQSQISGWGTVPDYLVLIRPWVIEHVYRFAIPSWTLESDDFSRLAIPFSLFLFTISLLAELLLLKFLPKNNWRQRLGLYVSAWLIFYISACGMANRGLGSMIRHSLPSYVIIVMAIANLLTNIQLPKFNKPSYANLAMSITFISLVAITFFSEFVLGYRYTHGMWVA